MSHPSATGQVGYLQLPALDIGESIRFYRAVFGWRGEEEHGSFEAPGLIGQWVTDRPPAPSAGPVLWLAVDSLAQTLARVSGNGGTVYGRPRPDQGERYLVEIGDPAGNRLGVVARARTAMPQTMIAVADVEASSRWYQQLLGLVSDHGGPEYERLLADGTLVLQLHHRDVEHHHGRIAETSGVPGSGVLLWFGEVGDFDGAVARAAELDAPILRAPHRNPPEGEGNGPAHREIWLRDPDGYTVVLASPDGEAHEPA
jgi:predicted enzyme related to lactoylglutathione lyase